MNRVNNIEQQKEETPIDLSVVEGFDTIDKRGSFSFIRTYDEKFAELNNSLKQFFRTEDIVIGNGIDELIDLLFLFFKNDLRLKRVLTLEPGYGRYKQSILRHGLVAVEFPRVFLYNNSLRQQSIESLISFVEKNKIDAVIFSNPGNPYPGYYSNKEIEKLLKKIDNTVPVILDEAFVEYAVKSNSQTALSLIKIHNNLFVLRTFSKIYGMFGLRVGVLIANKKYINPILCYKRRYTVPQPSISELISILKTGNLKKYWVDKYNDNKKRLRLFTKKVDGKYTVLRWPQKWSHWLSSKKYNDFFDGGRVCLFT